MTDRRFWLALNCLTVTFGTFGLIADLAAGKYHWAAAMAVAVTFGILGVLINNRRSLL